MKRILVFDGSKGARRFELCRIAIFSAWEGKPPSSRTREVIRAEARLLDALDTISVATPTDKDEDVRMLNNELSPSITVSQSDFDLLSRCADTVPWLPKLAREAVDLQDWLSSAEKLDA